MDSHLVKISIVNNGDNDNAVSLFQTSKVDTYARMWQFMDANAETVLVESTKEGVEKVRNSKGKYAFMLESPYNAYQNQRKPCNTMQVGEPLDSKGYGIATPMGFHLRLVQAIYCKRITAKVKYKTQKTIKIHKQVPIKNQCHTFTFNGFKIVTFLWYCD